MLWAECLCPSTFMCWSPTPPPRLPQCDRVRRWVLCGGDKGKMSSWGGALICRAGALMRGGRDTCALFLCQGRTQDLHTYIWVNVCCSLVGLLTSWYSHHNNGKSSNDNNSYNNHLLGGLVVNNPPANAGDTGSIPGSGRSPGGGRG